MYDKSLAKAGGRGWDASGVWRLAGGVWGPVETDPAAQLFLGASRPTSPVAEVTAIASVLRMLRAARVSIPLTILPDSQYALGVVLGGDRALSEIRLVQLARSKARCYRSVACDLAPWRALDASADEPEEIHMEPPAYMDDFSCQSSATRLLICFHGLLWPRRSPSRLLGSTGCS